MNAVFFDDVRVPVSHRVGARTMVGPSPNTCWSLSGAAATPGRGSGRGQAPPSACVGSGVALPEGSLAALEVTIEAENPRIPHPVGPSRGKTPGRVLMLKTLAGQARQRLSDSRSPSWALRPLAVPQPQRPGERRSQPVPRQPHAVSTIERCPLPGAQTRKQQDYCQARAGPLGEALGRKAAVSKG